MVDIKGIQYKFYLSFNSSFGGESNEKSNWAQLKASHFRIKVGINTKIALPSALALIMQPISP